MNRDVVLAFAAAFVSSLLAVWWGFRHAFDEESFR